MGTKTSTKTNKTTTSGYSHTYSIPQQGWECPRCNRINAPWVSQCNCGGGYWYWQPTWVSDHIYVGDKPEWWKDYVTCSQADSITNNPNIYTAGGSDYKTASNTYVNVSGTQSNKADPNSTTYAWNSVPGTQTIHNGKTNYKE